MNECKYTSDGKKVSIIGKLNNEQWIVQEIFINESGDEIPSGERFVTQNLHDLPLISYKVKEEIRIEQKIKDKELTLKNLSNKEKKIYESIKNLNHIYSSCKKSLEFLEENQMNHLFMIMSGNAKWVINNEYYFRAPITFNEFIKDDDRYDSGVKLITLFGNSEGDLEYRINQYKDSSGNNSKFYFYETYEEAVNHIKKDAIDLLMNDKLSKENYNLCLSLNIEFNNEEKKKYYSTLLKQINKDLDASLEGKDKLIKKISEYESEINYIQQDFSIKE